MFVRIKTVKSGAKTYEYVQIVENERQNGKTRQKVIANLGLRDELEKAGAINTVVNGLGRLTTGGLLVLEAYRDGSITSEWSLPWGGVLVFRKLWEDLRFPQLIERLLKGRQYDFDVEAAVFALALQRLFHPGSDLEGSKWIKTVHFLPFRSLQLQHLYRALDFLLPHKDKIEVELFETRRDLFTADVDLVFFDTTSLYFEGRGPAGLAERGHSKDHRPQDTQLVVCIIMGRDGFPISSEVWPGNTVDVTTVKQIVATLQKRFHIRKVVLVCDRGFVSAANLRRIRKAGMHYIVGMRMRNVNEVRHEVLSRPGRYHKVAENLDVKEVWVGRQRYIVCRNQQEVERDRQQRESMLRKLEETIATGQVKSLVGNKGYRTFLRIDSGSVSLNRDRIQEDARYDGKFVLRTSTEMPSAEVATAYKSLWELEALNRTFKDVIETRPVYHHITRRVKAHVFGSFLALLLGTTLRKRLHDRFESEARECSRALLPEQAHDTQVEPIPWLDLLRDMESLQAIKLTLNGKTFLHRTEFTGCLARVFDALGIRPPPRLQPWNESCGPETKAR
jgi:Transposase DDE domain